MLYIFNKTNSGNLILNHFNTKYLCFLKAFPVGADYLVSIRIHNYSNPTNQCEQCSNNNNHCCDRQQSSGTCDECNTFFEYCVRNFNGNGQCLKSHQFVDPGRISLDFSQEFVLLRQNPIVFRGPTRTWEVSHTAYQFPRVPYNIDGVQYIG